MTELEAREFVNDDLFGLYPVWKERASSYEIAEWVKIFKPYSLSDAQNCVQRYFKSADYTVQKPKPYMILKHMNRKDGKDKNFAWIQNTTTGVFYPLYYPANKDRDKVLQAWFDEYHPDGEWIAYRSDEKTNQELLNFQIEKEKEIRGDLARLEVGDVDQNIVDFCEKYNLPLDDDRVEIVRAKAKQKVPIGVQAKQILNDNEPF
jgi:hypothetical protein